MLEDTGYTVPSYDVWVCLQASSHLSRLTKVTQFCGKRILGERPTTKVDQNMIQKLYTLAIRAIPANDTPVEVPTDWVVSSLKPAEKTGLSSQERSSVDDSSQDIVHIPKSESSDELFEQGRSETKRKQKK